jgi:hypothetical protein
MQRLLRGGALAALSALGSQTRPKMGPNPEISRVRGVYLQDLQETSPEIFAIKAL